MKTPTHTLKIPEFIALMAVMTSILALSIDGILPALGMISRDFALTNPNDAQLIITSMFLGFAFGQIVVGPLSDSYGRKPIIYLGFGILILGSVLSFVATDMTMMLIGRILQGVGAAAPRIVGIAIVRDQYQGRAMARIMSMIMSIFILVPAIAPALGQGVLLIAHWRAFFALLIVFSIVCVVWFGTRQPETLAQDARRTFSMSAIIKGIKEAFSYRAMLGYTLASGLTFGAFVAYLSTAPQIFQSAYDTGAYFSLYFGSAALAIGAAGMFNAKWVERFGMRYMAWRALLGLVATAILFLPFVWLSSGLPPLWLFMVWLGMTFFCMGILFGNFNALAMEPVGHMAGLGAAIVGAVSTFLALPLAWAIGASFNGTVLPLVFGFAILGSAALIVMRWTERI